MRGSKTEWECFLLTSTHTWKRSTLLPLNLTNNSKHCTYFQKLFEKLTEKGKVVPKDANRRIYSVRHFEILSKFWDFEICHFCLKFCWNITKMSLSKGRRKYSNLCCTLCVIFILTHVQFQLTYYIAQFHVLFKDFGHLSSTKSTRNIRSTLQYWNLLISRQMCPLSTGTAGSCSSAIRTANCTVDFTSCVLWSRATCKGNCQNQTLPLER